MYTYACALQILLCETSKDERFCIKPLIRSTLKTCKTREHCIFIYMFPKKVCACFGRGDHIYMHIHINIYVCIYIIYIYGILEVSLLHSSQTSYPPSGFRVYGSGLSAGLELRDVVFEGFGSRPSTAKSLRPSRSPHHCARVLQRNA